MRSSRHPCYSCGVGATNGRVTTNSKISLPQKVLGLVPQLVKFLKTETKSQFWAEFKMGAVMIQFKAFSSSPAS